MRKMAFTLALLLPLLVSGCMHYHVVSRDTEESTLEVAAWPYSKKPELPLVIDPEVLTLLETSCLPPRDESKREVELLEYRIIPFENGIQWELRLTFRCEIRENYWES